jgi:hypothetical protein
MLVDSDMLILQVIDTLLESAQLKRKAAAKQAA